MLAAALIVFRETLEAALVIAIIAAATRGLPGRGRWIAFGLGAGTAGAACVALLARSIAAYAEGTGQDLFNAAVLFAATLMIGWHVVWMNQHGRVMAAELRAMGSAVTSGQKPLALIGFAIALTVLREGSEVVLMLQGLLAGGAGAASLAGAASGLAAGVLAGGLMYAGFQALPVARVFAITNILLVLIAAGMAARGVNFLAQAGWLPVLGGAVWDLRRVLPENGFAGQILAALVGYVARPSGLQVAAYVATLLAMLGFLLRTRLWHLGGAAALLVLAIVGGSAGAARAEEVKSPLVVQGEAELEMESLVAFDHDAALDGQQEHEFALGYGVNSFWKTELAAAFEQAPRDEPDEGLQHKAINWANTLALTEPGAFWLDPALYLELGWGRNGEADHSFSGGLLLGKDWGRTTHTFNLLLEGQSGDKDAHGLNVMSRWQSLYRLSSWVQPGFEVFYASEGANRFDDQQFTAGPVLVGKLPGFASGQNLRWQMGGQFGATSAAPEAALRWKLEYEFFF